MKQIFTVLILFLALTKMNAQIGMSKSEIIKERGSNYKEGKTNKGTPYIFYKKEYETKRSGKYTRDTTYYFKKTKTEELICYLKKIFEPSSEVNSFVKYYNNKGYVKLNELKWKNYENNIIYEVEVENGICTLSVYRDSN